jgi:hypothetical protein
MVFCIQTSRLTRPNFVPPLDLQNSLYKTTAYLEVTLAELDPNLLKLSLSNIIEANSAAQRDAQAEVKELSDEEIIGVCKFLSIIENLGFQLKIDVKELPSEQLLESA